MKQSLLSAMVLGVLSGPASAQQVVLNPVIVPEGEHGKFETISDGLWNLVAGSKELLYPPLAKRARLGGTVPVLLSIDPAGNVIEVGTLKVGTYHPAVVYPATSWAAQLKFPALAPGENTVRKFQIFVIFTQAGEVKIQPTADTKFR